MFAKASIMTAHRAFGSFITLVRNDGIVVGLKSLVDRSYVRWFEWRLGIRSESLISLEELGIENPHCRPYVPSDYKSLLTVLRSITVRPGEDVFLDFGSGLGRVVIAAAANCSFQKVIGVDIATTLNDLARENVRKALPRLKCRDVEIVTADATQFEVPPEVTIIYFFNPFCGEVLERVLANIHNSVRAAPRPVRLICKVPETSGFEMEIRRCPWVTPEREVVFDANCRYLFFSVRA
jgi:SAM-dependent methyltransferase